MDGANLVVIAGGRPRPQDSRAFSLARQVNVPYTGGGAEPVDRSTTVTAWTWLEMEVRERLTTTASPGTTAVGARQRVRRDHVGPRAWESLLS